MSHDAPDTAAFKDMWAPYPFWRFVGTMLLKGVITTGPLVLAILVGFFGFFALSPAVFVVAVLLEYQLWYG